MIIQARPYTSLTACYFVSIVCSLGIAAMFVHIEHQLEKQFVQVNSISFNVMPLKIRIKFRIAVTMMWVGSI
jgi:hypothetical protein